MNWRFVRLRQSGYVGVVQHAIIEKGALAVDVKNLQEVEAFITKDGSEIRELLAHRNSVIRKQSLAEARLKLGARTAAHYHPKTEEIYYILQGGGEMTINQERRSVGPGDAIAIPPGEVHTIFNSGTEPLVFLCCCAPGYENEDTVLVSGLDGVGD